ncbi:MAG: citramalate synthase, partial [Bryobacteraceae bacterium]
VYDAEHFFDGYIANPGFALRTLEAARKAGADVLCLCDTNGGTLTGRLTEIVALVVREFGGIIGIHTHNDSDVSVANTLAAVDAGATHVQGCMNGYGERCGNANLCSIIANLELKSGHTAIGSEKLKNLTSTSRFIAELANLPLRNDQPYVGQSAFAHKGGIHVSAVMKDAATYEHVAPELVGNSQRVLLSDLSGRSNVFYKLNQHGLADTLDEGARRELLERIKHMEYQGYELEAAEGTFELMVREALNPDLQHFELVGYEVSTKVTGTKDPQTTATVTLKAQDGVHSATANGNGPVNALDLCLRQCLAALYPGVANVRLTDYKVRVLDSKKGTGAKVRVLIEWSDHERSWGTVGVSDNVIEASWHALVDAVRLELMRLAERDDGVQGKVVDYS